MRPRWQPMGRSGSSALLVNTKEGFLLDDQLIQAYRATNYRVHATEPFALRIGRTCAACDALLDTHGVTTAAYLTAWNPYSKAVSDAANAAGQAKLIEELNDVSTAVLSGEGSGETGDWPPEPSLFAMGISREIATILAQKYQQNAFVWIERGKAAELVICQQ